MTPIAQFDPSSLFVCLDLRFFQDASVGADQDKALRQYDFTTALYGGAPREIIATARALSGEDRFDAAYLATCYWHEQRHFLDFVLTNWGAFRVRNFIHAYANLPLVIGALRMAGFPLVLPLDTCLDDVALELLGVASKPPAPVLDIARRFADRRDAVNDGHEFDTELGKLQVGAEAQFEVLAWINQMGNVAEHLGPEAFAEADARVRALTGAPRLAMHLARLFQTHGLLAPGAVADAEFIGNTAMMNAVLLASLCARTLAPEEQEAHDAACARAAHDAAGDEELQPYFPAVRMARLVRGLSAASDQTWRLSAGNAWDVVNRACHKYWGRTAVEELEADIEREAGSVALVDELYGGVASLPEDEQGAGALVPKAFAQFHDLRERLFAFLKESPASFISPAAYATDLAPRLRPMVMSCMPGASTTVRSGFRAMHWLPLERPFWAFWRPKMMWWSGSYQTRPAADEFCVAEPDLWNRLAVKLAPVGKLLTNGLRHNIVNRVEMTFADEALRYEAGVPVIIRPAFARPPPSRSAAGYFRATRHSPMLCDICGARLEREDDALVISVFDIVDSEPLRLKVHAYSGLDYSDWVIHRACVEGIALRQF